MARREIGDRRRLRLRFAPVVVFGLVVAGVILLIGLATPDSGGAGGKLALVGLSKADCMSFSSQSTPRSGTMIDGEKFPGVPSGKQAADACQPGGNDVAWVSE